MCTTNSRIFLTVSILPLPYLLVNYFRLPYSLYPLFFVFFPHFSDYLLSFPFIFFSFQGYRHRLRTPVREHFWDTLPRADALKIKKKIKNATYLGPGLHSGKAGPDNFCRLPPISSALVSVIHYLYFLSSFRFVISSIYLRKLFRQLYLSSKYERYILIYVSLSFSSLTGLMIPKLTLVSNGNISQWRAGSNYLLLSIRQMVFMDGTAGSHTLQG